MTGVKLATMVMAHRYLYFKIKKPIISDDEFNDLVILVANHELGSHNWDLEESYTPQEIAIAHMLLRKFTESKKPKEPVNVKQRRIYIVGGDIQSANWMMPTAIETDMSKSDLVVFSGGEDVSPHLYGKKAHPSTLSNPRRDKFEKEEFDKALALNKPMLGICRGAQFLCVMAGGILIQHQHNPDHFHPMRTKENTQIRVTSSHHQAQFPWYLDRKDFKMLGWTYTQSLYHYGEGKDEMIIGVIDGDDGKYDRVELEEVYYAKINALGLQHHPE